MSDLNERKALILKAIVSEYVLYAEPVASQQIADIYQMGVRSATIRNEMAEMSELGYLEQPHTSAGRIPSDQGYRYFVDNLLDPAQLDPDQRHALEAAAQLDDTLREIVRHALRRLSQLVGQLTVAAIVKDSQVSVRKVVLTAVGPNRAMLILILSNGHVENRILECPTGLTLEHLGQANERLESATEGKGLRALARFEVESTGSPLVDRLMLTAARSLHNLATDLTQGILIFEGEENLFGQPEFRAEPAAARRILEYLEGDRAFYELLVESVPYPVPTVSIGQEHPQAYLHGLSVIRQPFFLGPVEAGTIAVVGPTRVDYERATVLIDLTARAVSDTLTRLLAG